MLNKLIASYVREEDGATAIEYGLIAAGIAVAIAVTVGLVGGDLNGVFEGIQTTLSGGGSSS